MAVDRITADDVLRAGSPWRDCELWDGLPMVREPSGGWAQEIASRVAVPLGAHVRARNLGWIFLSEQGFLVARSPDRLLAPDTAYVSRARLPKLPARGFVPLAPDFAIEVRSPEDRWEWTVQKCATWIAHGTGVAWAIDPQGRRVAVFRAAEPAEVVVEGGVVDAGPVLPDFQLPVDDLFAGLEE